MKKSEKHLLMTGGAALLGYVLWKKKPFGTTIFGSAKDTMSYMLVPGYDKGYDAGFSGAGTRQDFLDNYGGTYLTGYQDGQKDRQNDPTVQAAAQQATQQAAQSTANFSYAQGWALGNSGRPFNTNGGSTDPNYIKGYNAGYAVFQSHQGH